MAKFTPITTLGTVSSAVGGSISAFAFSKIREAKSFMRALDAPFAIMNGSHGSSGSVWESQANNYKIVLIVGLIILVVGIILIVTGISSNMQDRQVQKNPAPTISSVPENDKTNVRERIEKLNALKADGLISEEEYAEKKRDILSSL